MAHDSNLLIIGGAAHSIMAVAVDRITHRKPAFTQDVVFVITARPEAELPRVVTAAELPRLKAYGKHASAGRRERRAAKRRRGR